MSSKERIPKFIPKSKEQLSFISNLISSLNETQLCEKHAVFYSGSDLFRGTGVWGKVPASEQASRDVPAEGKMSHVETAPRVLTEVVTPTFACLLNKEKPGICCGCCNT